MRTSLWLQNRKLCLLAFVSGIAVGVTASTYAQQRFDQIVLGRSGAVSGVATFMPPDGTGWYHIDNPGHQRLRISGGGSPGQYEYLTISHPGTVTIRGDLYVTGNISSPGGQAVRSPSARIPPLPGQGAKADDARPQDVRNLQRQIDELWSKVNTLLERVNNMP